MDRALLCLRNFRWHLGFAVLALYLGGMATPHAAPPTDLAVRLIGPESEDVNLTWSAEEGTQYTVERCVDLDGWEPVPGMEDLTTDEGVISLTDLGAAAAETPAYFYRVRAVTGIISVPVGFALIPAGTFMMGTNDVSIARPEHAVNVSAFFIAIHETTKELWDEVREWGLNNGYTDLPIGNGSSASKGVNHPVHTVSWYHVVKWCNARSQMDGLTPCYFVDSVIYKLEDHANVVCNFNADGYRLPTEAEWEKAARGGQSGWRFPWGETISHDQANYNSSSFASHDVSPTRGFHPTYEQGEYPYTSPVGSFAPNGFGLYDMAGNQPEWCWDWFGSTYYNSSPESDPRGPSSGAWKVHRGGSWFSTAPYCRVYQRPDSGAPPTLRTVDMGFRVARGFSQ